MGFDMVAFGGKGIRGPQSAGLLIGRKDLIAAARRNAPPNGDTIGRGMKVNKEEMVGMLAAVERYVEIDHQREGREFDKRAETIRAGAASVPGVKASVSSPKSPTLPALRVTWPGGTRASAAEGSRAARRRKSIGHPPKGCAGHRRRICATARIRLWRAS